MPRATAVNFSIPVEFRGYYIINGTSYFSLRDMEMGGSWWAQIGQVRSGFKVEAFNPTKKELVISWNQQAHTLLLKEFENSRHFIALESMQISPLNQKVYEMSERLIQSTLSQETGRLVKDNRKVEQLRRFLAQNPSLSELNDFLPEMGDAINYDEFFKIEFPPIMTGRNKQNTPRWGIDKSVDLKEIESMIASGASTEDMNRLLTEK
ncbi:hypothetical protein SH580_12185 [Coraliomargarita algicola]|uniref:Uncharacterized protein n=1 Tax=Coraliomargarita algicola TaxID=3092156 RepID=A0ABZ0RGX7_9BACT|nr:hypothetical protein [Coraliomargarita sp. J2-16]WPJ94192.1 hypothetical protein SH580_12185 [Coraliomargarita sp. J2-16]